MLAASLFALGLAEELWQAYLPVYLAALGASGIVVGLFASTRDLLDSLYQYPGGWLSDRLGRRRSLITFTAIAGAGYLIYALAPGWPWMFAGLAAVMAWKAGAFPTTFAIVGDALPVERRGRAFAVQSTLVRIPRIIGAPLGGAVVASVGLQAGLPPLIGAAVAIAVGVLALQVTTLRDRPHDSGPSAPATAAAAWTELPGRLKHLLAADCLVRFGEGIAASFIVLHVLQRPLLTPADYGLLYAVQQAVAIASYLPGGRVADAAGRAPLVTATFLFFAAFPLAVRMATGRAALVLAFAMGGLKEIGEPARKSMIVDLAPPDRRASAVGIYYTVRNLVMAPAGLIGGWLWQRSPDLPLEVASLASLAGCALFVVQVRATGLRKEPPVRRLSSRAR